MNSELLWYASGSHLADTAGPSMGWMPIAVGGEVRSRKELREGRAPLPCAYPALAFAQAGRPQVDRNLFCPNP